MNDLDLTLEAAHAELRAALNALTRGDYAAVALYASIAYERMFDDRVPRATSVADTTPAYRWAPYEEPLA